MPGPKLTPAQKLAVKCLREGDDYDDGWGIMVTNFSSRVEDGQAWIYFKTALRLEAKGVVELDTRFGRLRLVDR
jgi:hypothetical protein